MSLSSKFKAHNEEKKKKKDQPRGRALAWWSGVLEHSVCVCVWGELAVLKGSTLILKHFKEEERNTQPLSYDTPYKELLRS